jgi:serine/threonine-protein kinase
VDGGTRSFWVALADQSSLREQLTLRVGFWVCLSLLLPCGFAVTLFEGPRTSVFFLFALSGTGWFALRRATLHRPRFTRVARLVGYGLVVMAPAAVIGVLSQVRHPAFGFGAWLPAQLYMLVITISILRLRPATPAVVGALSAVSYVAMYLIVRPSLPDDAGGLERTWGGSVTLFRASCLVLWGGMWGGITLGLRRTISRAISAMRARDLFGKYRVGEEIAAGGMGTVCRATYCPEGGFAREVAFKRIHPELARDEVAVRRFRREAELGARLHHHNIVTSLDFGRVDDTYFFAMEFVDGATLRELVRASVRAGRRIPERVVAHLGRQACQALHFAHAVATDEQGRRLRVLHRDICPDNLLVSRSGQLKLADFGVALALRERAMYQSDKITGKLAYLAPERLKARAYDHRADLFSLGVVLFEALAGRRLFARKEEENTVRSILASHVPDIRRLRPDIDPHWRAFFFRALAPTAEGRFLDADHMDAELAALLGDPMGDEELQAWLRPLLQAELLADLAAQSDPTAPTEDLEPTFAAIGGEDDDDEADELETRPDLMRTLEDESRARRRLSLAA